MAEIGGTARAVAALAVTLWCLAAQPLPAQTADPEAPALADEVIVVPVADHTISVLVTHRPGATRFTHAVAIFPGAPGQGRLRAENGEIKYDNQRGNPLVRGRHYFLEDGFVTIVVDAPSDYQTGLFSHSFRASERYGEDIRAVAAAINKRFGDLDWTFAGHSEGTVSAINAARMAAPYVRRVVLMSTMTVRNFQGGGVSAVDFRGIKVPVLVVGHRSDPCRFSRYERAKDLAQETKSIFLSVSGAQNGRGDACGAFSEHGFVGMEEKTFKAVLLWIRSGRAPADVSE